ncbi:hypothetical protein BH23GEM4_BH23GEM4_18020 [soil metagenome]
MADINVERREGANIWPWIIGLIVLALLIWALAEAFGGDDEVAVEPVPVENVEPLPPVAAPPAVAAIGLPVAAILANPASYFGQTVSGEARVVEVPTDRGFWIEDGGQRMFVLINEPPNETMDVNVGQTVMLSNAEVYDSSNMGEIEDQIDADTRRVASGTPAVLAVNHTDVEILNRP